MLPTGREDIRVVRTRAALREALLSLIEEKGFDAIVVQDIAQRAQINRVTFYKHYHDKYDLLEQIMREIITELVSHIGDLLIVTSTSQPNPRLVEWFEQVGANARFYRLMLGKDGNASFAARLREYIETMVEQAHAASPLAANERHVAPFPIQNRFGAAGFLGVTEWWLDQRQPMPPREIALHLQRLLLLLLPPAP